MPIVLDERDELELEAIEAMWDELRRADELFSTYKEDSEISRLNRGALALEDAHPDVREVLARCDELRTITGGFFDAGGVLEHGVDPSGLVKGWAAEGAATQLARLRGFDHYLNAGGDVTGRVASRCPAWQVAVQDPQNTNAFLTILELRSGGVATSGSAERGQHIIDPHTGRHPGDLLAVTVTGPSLLWADVFATAAFARGGEDVEEWVATCAPGYEVAALARAP